MAAVHLVFAEGRGGVTRDANGKLRVPIGKKFQPRGFNRKRRERERERETERETDPLEHAREGDLPSGGLSAEEGRKEERLQRGPKALKPDDAEGATTRTGTGHRQEALERVGETFNQLPAPNHFHPSG